MKKNYMNFKQKLFALSSILCFIGIENVQAQCPEYVQLDGIMTLCQEHVSEDNGRTIVASVMGSGEPNFKWYKNNEFVTDQSNIDIREVGLYKCTVEISGCDLIQEEFEVSYATIPTLTIDGNLNICQGATTELTGGSENSSLWNVTNYYWGELESNVLEVTQAGTYTLKAVTDIGCVYYQEATVSQISLQGNYSGQTICLGSTLNIQDNNDLEQTGNAGVTYQIYNNSLIIEANKVSDNLTLNNIQPIDYYIVKTQNGCQDIKYFTPDYYTAPSTPNLVNTTERCGPGEVTFINNDGFGAFKIYNAQSGGDLITDGLTIGNVQQSGTYYISSIDENTCESERIEVTATIKDLPYIGFIDNVEICAGGTVTLIENSIGRNSKVNAVASFAIYADQGLTELVSNDLTITGINSFGSYYVVKTENGCNAPTSTVQVNERYLYIYATQDSPLCDQSEAAISSFSDFEDLNPTYNWFLNSSPYQSNTSYINTSQAGTYKVVATIPGCNSVEEQITISNAASISTDITGDLTFCSGESTTLNAVNNNNYTYDWYDGNITISYSSSIQIYKGGNIQLTITDGNTGCQSITNVDVTSIEVFIGNFTSDTVCQGGDITFTEISNNRIKSPIDPSYAIYSEQNFQNIVSNNLTLTNVHASGTYYIVKTENGCNSSEVQVSTIVNEVPVFTYNKEGSFITANITSESKISSFWLLDCNGPFDISSNTNEIRIPSSSNYKLSVIDSNGCSSTSLECIEVSILAGDINGNGTIENDHIADNTRIKTPVANEIAGDVDLDGIINGSEIIGDLNGNYVIDGSEVEGDYNGNFRIDASENIITSVNNNQLASFTAYPNPAADFINISFPAATIGNVSIINVNGIEVSNQTINGSFVKLNTSSLSNGVYVLKVNSNNGFATQQIVIAK